MATMGGGTGAAHDRIAELEAENAKLRAALAPASGSAELLLPDTPPADTLSEAILRESEAKFHAIADSIDQMIWSTRSDGFHDYFNRRWYEFTGVAEGSTDGEEWNGIFHPEDRERTWAVWRRSLATGEPYHIEYRLRHRSGAYRWVLGRARPVRDEAGGIVRWYGSCTDIQDLKAAEEALRESRTRLRAFMDNMPDVLFIKDLDGRYVEANKAFLHTVRRAAEEVIGRGDADLFPAEVVAEFAEEDRKVRETGAPRRFEETFDYEGRRLTFLTQKFPLPDGQVAGIGTDITDRKEAEEALRESDARLRVLTDNLPLAMVYQVLTSRDMSERSYVYVSANSEQVTGVPAEEAMRDPAALMGLIEPETLEPTLAAEREAADALRTLDIEITGRRRNGAVIKSRVISKPRELPDGRLLWDGILIDITERKQAQEAAERTAALLSAIGDATPDLIFAKDAECRLIYGNAATAATLGVSPEQLPGMSNSDFARDPEEARALDENDRSVIDSGVAQVVEETYTSPDGTTRIFRSAKTPMRDGEGRVIGIAGVATDITARRAAEEEIRLLNETLEQRVAAEIERRTQAEEALRQAQKMETLGQLTGGVAHDFNNLLQIVTGNLEILERNLPDEAGRLRRAADNALRGAERAAVLTQRLLAFSRRQPLDPKPLNLNRLVAGMSELLHRTLGETVEVETVLASALWAVEADRNQLENAIINLAVNARDAMPNGGKLTIETANTHLDRGYTAQNAEVSPGQYVAICVSDTGSGMDPETVERVFEPFFTTKEVGKGTGLGLSMVYGFVKQSGGHVKIYSEPGHGTTVKIYLPRLHGGDEEEQAEAQAPVPEGTQEETILVCEDDDDVRAYSVEVLRELGYRVIEAHDGPSALRLLERQEGRVDLLFTDVVLPSGMTGADVAEQARALRPDLKVLFTTGYARSAIVHHGRLDPGVELITKPFSYADLAARIRDMLDAAG